MTLPPSNWLGFVYAASEVALTLRKRSGRGASSQDRGSMALIWVVIGVSIFTSVLVRINTPWATSLVLIALRPLWLGVFVAGLALRWWSIIHLGRFFTVNVAIAADQVVIDDGPYRWVRHPSYTGALAAFLAYALYTGHWLGALVVVLPIGAAFWRRILVEEAALSAGLDEPYRAYMRRTKRLIPFVV